jgi:hypothetical protein
MIRLSDAAVQEILLLLLQSALNKESHIAGNDTTFQ